MVGAVIARPIKRELFRAESKSARLEIYSEKSERSNPNLNVSKAAMRSRQPITCATVERRFQSARKSYVKSDIARKNREQCSCAKNKEK